MANDNTVTGLVNRALGFLGEQTITNSDSPETPNGRLMVDIYPMCRREVLRRVSWNFAETWGTLNYYGPAPTGFDYQDTYALPADYIRVVDIPSYTQLQSGTAISPGMSVDFSNHDYSIQDYRFINMNGQRLIALDNNQATTLAMAYIADIDNLTLWDPLALKVLAMWMAMDIAKSATGKSAIVQQLDSLLTKDLQDAVGVNGNEQRKRQHNFSRVQRDRETAYLGTPGFFTPVTGYTPSS